MNILDFLRVNTSEDRFAKQVMKRLREQGWLARIEYDRNQFALTFDGGIGRVFLHNLYREWSAASPIDKTKELDRAIAFILEPKEVADDFEFAAPLLLPAIRNRCAIVSQWLDPALGMDKDHYGRALKPLCDGLAILVAVDQPTAINLVNQDELAKWGQSFESVLAIAAGNLAKRTASRFERLEGGFYVSCFEDYYDASRWLIPRLFNDLPLRGGPVAVATSRSGIAVAGSEDIDALNAMAVFIESRAEEETRPISNLPLVLRAGEWQSFDCSHPDLAALDRLRAMQWLQDYADQKALLDPHLERTGRDVFVAKLGGIKDRQRIRTWTSWTSEAVSLLPEADVVAMRKDNRSMVRRWSDMVEHCGPLKLESGLYPRRYLVETGPDEEAWERLSRCAHPIYFPKPPSETH